MDVLEFKGDYEFLSNFYPSKVYYEGAQYPTVEHAYQAAKTNDLSQREKILKASGPGGAKKIGQSVAMRKDWEDVKIKIMKDLVRQKFENRRLRINLLGIDGIIQEGNFWGDTFWGICKGKGRNELGIILMSIRSELRNKYGHYSTQE
jgi:ribA/ribD-fused uncharacterized protein